MPLWRPRRKNGPKAWRKKRIKDPNDALIQGPNSFFISDEGRKNGIEIDFVERRQAAQRPRPIHKS